jgi:hypothetical protein
MTFSRHKSIQNKFRRDNIPPEEVPFIYKHLSLYEDTAIPCIEQELIEWCENHCQQPWAWWFDAEHGYIGFASQEELMQFRLSV